VAEVEEPVAVAEANEPAEREPDEVEA